MRIIWHRDGNKTAAFTEDKHQDRSKIFDKIADEIKSLPIDQFIIDTEMVEWIDNKPIPREHQMWMIVGKEPMRNRDVHVNIHDVLFYGEEGAINELSYKKRLEFLDKLLPKDLKYLKKTSWWEVHNKKEFDEALKKAYDYPGSEGSMLKSSDSQYLPGVARIVDWCVYDNTEILTPNGYKYAHELQTGDFVISKDCKPHRIIHITRRRLQDSEKLYSIWGPLYGEQFFVTGNHEMLIHENWHAIEDFSSEVLLVPSIEPTKFEISSSRIFVENRDGFYAIAKRIYYFYDFEVDGEDSYCTRSCILHNSKIKVVKEASFKIVGRMKKAMPFETIGRDQPAENIDGEEAFKLYKRLQEKSKTWIFRCALKNGKEYVTIDTESTITESDLHVKWNAGLTKDKWQGLDDPRLWEMLDGFEHRKPGENSYGATYAKSFDIDPKLGMIMTVAPVQIIETKGVADKRILSWMFPKVRELKPEAGKEPDDVKDLKHLIEIRKITTED